VPVVRAGPLLAVGARPVRGGKRTILNNFLSVNRLTSEIDLSKLDFTGLAFDQSIFAHQNCISQVRMFKTLATSLKLSLGHEIT
jgi:hypothetical protein